MREKSTISPAIFEKSFSPSKILSRP